MQPPDRPVPEPAGGEGYAVVHGRLDDGGHLGGGTGPHHGTGTDGHAAQGLVVAGVVTDPVAHIDVGRPDDGGQAVLDHRDAQSPDSPRERPTAAIPRSSAKAKLKMTSSAPASMWPATSPGTSSGWPTTKAARSSGGVPGGQHRLDLGRVLLRGGHDERGHPGDVDLGRVATDLGAVPVEHLDLVGQHGGVAGHVALVGVLGHQPEGALLAPAPDHDPGPTGPDRPGQVAGVVQSEVVTGRSSRRHR